MKTLLRAMALCAAIGAVPLMLGGCAGAIPHKSSSDTLLYLNYAGAPVDDFFSFRLDSWEAVSANQLVLWSDVNKAYLLQVWDSCPDLKFAFRIGVTSTAHRISRLDSVSVDHQRCPIVAIRPIDVKKMKADRASPNFAG
jgi:Family of unknown function (DUF6491)